MSQEKQENTENNKSFFNGLNESFLHSLIQGPLNGAVQIIDKTSQYIAKHTNSKVETNLLPHVQIIQELEPAKKTYSPEWWGQQIGSGFGMMPTFGLVAGATRMALSRSASYLAETLSSPKLANSAWLQANPFYSHFALGKGAPFAIAEASSSGFLYDAIFKATAENPDKQESFLNSRLKQGLIGASTFGIMSSSSLAFRGIGRTSGLSENILAHPLTNISLSGISGAIGGFASAHLHAYMDNRQLKDGELMESIVSMAAGGFVLPAGHKAFNLGLDHINLARGKGIPISRFSEYQQSHKSKALHALEQEHGRYRIQFDNENPRIDRQNKMIYVKETKEKTGLIPKAEVSNYAHELSHGQIASNLEPMTKETYLNWRIQRELEAQLLASKIELEFKGKNTENIKPTEAELIKAKNKIKQEYESPYLADFERLKDPNTNLIIPKDHTFVEYARKPNSIAPAEPTDPRYLQLVSELEHSVTAQTKTNQAEITLQHNRPVSRTVVRQYWEKFEEETKQQDPINLLKQIEAIEYYVDFGPNPEDSFVTKGPSAINIAKGKLTFAELQILADRLRHDPSEPFQSTTELSTDNLKKAIETWKLAKNLPPHIALELTPQSDINKVAASLAFKEIVQSPEFRYIDLTDQDLTKDEFMSLFRTELDEIKVQAREKILQRSSSIEAIRLGIEDIYAETMSKADKDLLAAATQADRFEAEFQISMEQIVRAKHGPALVRTLKEINPVIQGLPLEDGAYPIQLTNIQEIIANHPQSLSDSIRLVSVYGPHWQSRKIEDIRKDEASTISNHRTESLQDTLLRILGDKELPLLDITKTDGLAEALIKNQDQNKKQLYLMARFWSELGTEIKQDLNQDPSPKSNKRKQEILSQLEDISTHFIDSWNNRQPQESQKAAIFMLNNRLTDLNLKEQSVLHSGLTTLFVKLEMDTLYQPKSMIEESLKRISSLNHEQIKKLISFWEVDHTFPYDLAIEADINMPLWQKVILNRTWYYDTKKTSDMLNPDGTISQKTRENLAREFSFNISQPGAKLKAAESAKPILAVRILHPELSESEQLILAETFFSFDTLINLKNKQTEASLERIVDEIMSENNNAPAFTTARLSSLDARSFIEALKLIEPTTKEELERIEQSKIPEQISDPDYKTSDRFVPGLSKLRALKFASMLNSPDQFNELAQKWLKQTKSDKIKEPYLLIDRLPFYESTPNKASLDKLYKWLETNKNLPIRAQEIVAEHWHKLANPESHQASDLARALQILFSDKQHLRLRQYTNKDQLESMTAAAYQMIDNGLSKHVAGSQIETLQKALAFHPESAKILSEIESHLRQKATINHKLIRSLVGYEIESSLPQEIAEGLSQQEHSMPYWHKLATRQVWLDMIEKYGRKDDVEQTNNDLYSKFQRAKIILEEPNSGKLKNSAKEEFDSKLAALIESPRARLRLTETARNSLEAVKALKPELNNTDAILLAQVLHVSGLSMKEQAKVLESISGKEFQQALDDFDSAGLTDWLRTETYKRNKPFIPIEGMSSRIATQISGLPESSRSKATAAWQAWQQESQRKDLIDKNNLEEMEAHRIKLQELDRVYRKTLKELYVLKGNTILQEKLGKAESYPEDLSERIGKYDKSKVDEAIRNLKELLGTHSPQELSRLWLSSGNKPGLKELFSLAMDSSSEINYVRNKLGNYLGTIPQNIANTITKYDPQQQEVAIEILRSYLDPTKPRLLGEPGQITSTIIDKLGPAKPKKADNTKEDPLKTRLLQEINARFSLADPSLKRAAHLIDQFDLELVKEALTRKEFQSIAIALNQARQKINTETVSPKFPDYNEIMEIAGNLENSPQRQALGAILTFGTNYQKWLNSMSTALLKLSTRTTTLSQGHAERTNLAHDSAYFLPISSKEKLTGLAEKLDQFKNRIDEEVKYISEFVDAQQRPNRKEKTVDGFRAITLVAESWPDLSPEIRKLDRNAIVAHLSEGKYDGVLHKGLEAILPLGGIKAGNKPGQFEEVQHRILISANTPVPAPLNHTWQSQVSDTTKLVGQFQARLIEPNKETQTTENTPAIHAETELRNQIPIAVAGRFSGCCQHIGGAAENLAWYTQESPNAGLFIIHNPRKPNEFVTQSAFFAGPDGTALLDSIESTNISKDHAPHVAKIYQDMADYLTGTTPLSELPPGPHPYYGKYKRVVTTNAAKFSQLPISETSDSQLQQNHNIRIWREAKNHERTKLPSDFTANHADVNKTQYIISENPKLQELTSEDQFIPLKLTDIYVTGLRGADLKQIPEINEIVKRSYPESEQNISDGNLGLVLRHRSNNKIIGYAVLDSKQRIVTDLVVDPEFQSQNKGAGQDKSARARAAGILFNSVADIVQREGGIWKAQLKRSTSFKLLMDKAERDMKRNAHDTADNEQKIKVLELIEKPSKSSTAFSGNNTESVEHTLEAKRVPPSYYSPEPYIDSPESNPHFERRSSDGDFFYNVYFRIPKPNHNAK